MPQATKLTDVPGGHSHAESIATIDRAGVSIGCPDRTYRPDQQVTRGQMASFLVRALDLPAGTATFSDVSSTHTHSAAIAAPATAGITTGFTDGTFRPDEPVGHVRDRGVQPRARVRR